MFLQPQARLRPVTSAVNSACGIFIRPNYPTRILQVSYSFFDSAFKFIPSGAVSFNARVAVIIGPFGDDVSNFSPTYDLTPYNAPIDHVINDLGPGNILLAADADESYIEPGMGYTILLSAPIVTGIAGTQFIGKLNATSKSVEHLLVNSLSHSAASSGGAAPAPTDTNGGGSSSSGSGGTTSTGGGAVSSGGTGTGGGGIGGRVPTRPQL